MQILKCTDLLGNNERYYKQISLLCRYEHIPEVTYRAWLVRNPDKEVYVSKKHGVKVEKVYLVVK